MQFTILLDKNEDTEKIELQEQSRFIKSIIESLEVPIEFDPDVDLSIEQKQKFKKDLENFQIKIIRDVSGSINIYVDSDLIATWYKPTYKLKKDYSQVDHKKQLYLEMLVNFGSIFEEEQM